MRKLAIKERKAEPENKISYHFKEKELMCPHCKMILIHPLLLYKLEKLRFEAGGGEKALHVNSGYRCPTHNKKVDGEDDSLHLFGQAADVRMDGVSPQDLAEIAEKLGFDGIGVYDNYVHVDIRGFPAHW